MPLFSQQNKQPEDERKGPKETVKFVDRLQEEANQRRKTETSTGLTQEDLWERDGRLYVGDHWGRSGHRHTEEGFQAHHHDQRLREGNYTINRTQQAVIAQRAMAFSRPVQFRFTPTGSGGEEAVFLRPEFGRDVLELENQAENQGQPITRDDLGLGDLSDEQLVGRESVRPRQAQALIENGVLDEDDDIIRVNGRVVSQALQKLWDTLYRDSRGPQAAAMNELYCAIFGVQPLLFEWDAEEERFSFTNPHVLNVWIDPTAEDIEDAEYVILDSILSAEKAKSIWPDKAEKINKAAHKKELRSTRLRLSSVHSLSYERDMLTVRTAWVRNRPVSMTLPEALRKDAVRTVQLDDDGNRTTEIGPDERARIAIEDSEVRVTLTSGDVVSAVLERTDTGGKTLPHHENWPKIVGIEQIQTLPQIEELVEEKRNPYRDIPLGWNKNIPVPYSPYGQGDPERIEDLQQAINRLFTILHRHAKFYQAPMEFWPDDLFQDLKKKGVSPYSKPGRIIPVRRDIYQLMIQLGGQNGFGVINQVPQPPSFYVQLLEILLAEIDRLANFTDVLQGAAPGSDTSGRAIEALQAAARGPIAVKTAFTEWMLERIASLGLDAISRWLSEAKMAEIIDDFPLPVLREIRRRIKPDKFNIEVSIASGRGVNEAADAERALELYMQGDPARLISRARAQAMNDVVDREAETRQISEENRTAFGTRPKGQGGQAASQASRQSGQRTAPSQGQGAQ